MTGFAKRGALYMRWRLTQRGRAIMTTGTPTNDLIMINRRHGHKYGGAMASITDIAGLYVRR